MIGAKRWDTREGASMWVPSYYPGSCVSRSSALLPWSLIAAVFTSSAIIFIIFTSPLTQGHVLRFTDWGPGECDMWHVIMWWHLSCVLRVGNTSLVTTPMMLVTRHWPVRDQCDIIMTSAWQRKSINNPLLWQQCPDSDEADTVLVSDVSIMTAMSPSWAVHQWPLLSRILTRGGIFIKCAVWQVTMYWSPCLHKALLLTW